MKYIAHRGKDNHSFFENSKEALLWCLKQDYIDGVELDVRMTKDHQFVLRHNSTLLVLGMEYHFIANETLESLKKINFNTLEKPHYLTSLKEFLEAVDSEKMILLDLKLEIGDAKKYVDTLYNLLEEYSHLSIYVCSFSYQIVKLCSTKRKFAVGLLISDFMNKNKDYDICNFLSVSKGAFFDIHSPKKKMVWNIRTKKDLKGIPSNTYVITDNASYFVSE